MRAACKTALLVLAGLMPTAVDLRAQSLEGVLMPGKVIEGHAKLESECRNCHVLLNKAAQDGLCLDCHKDVARDVTAQSGYHGRIDIGSCRSCHTEHKGRSANIAPLDENRFDHALTDFSLKGKHVEVRCGACHKAGSKPRAAPGACIDCHRKDDVHKGSLGATCADCHTERNWKQATFDHAKTRFALLGKHADVECKACHRTTAFKETPRVCVACHRRDDKHKGRFGEKCESCHNAKDWKTILFNHDVDTGWALRGGHREAKCTACHTGFLYRDKLQTQCVACHRQDDAHKGSLGNACGDCHVERSWKETRFDHSKTRFPLLGKHSGVKCADCHRDPNAKNTPSACVACHRKDDKHKGLLGEKCETCHGERSWKTVRFDHDRDTRYPLRGKHRSATCQSCHTQPAYKVKLASTCIACHAKDDAHKGQEGERCEQCHQESNWKKTDFDHGRSRFPLVGRHLQVACGKCHATARFKDVKSTCFACHEKEDIHKRRFGTQCEGCHNARDWKIWDFDHGRKTQFMLDGAHARIDCYACHKLPVEGRAALPQTCVGCHAGDDVHDGAFGRQCEKCHVTSSFRTVKQRIGGSGRAQQRAALAPLAGWVYAALRGEESER